MKAIEHLRLARPLALGSMVLLCLPTPRIGLISLGKQDPSDPSEISRFDYFRVYRP